MLHAYRTARSIPRINIAFPICPRSVLGYVKVHSTMWCLVRRAASVRARSMVPRLGSSIDRHMVTFPIATVLSKKRSAASVINYTSYQFPHTHGRRVYHELAMYNKKLYIIYICIRQWSPSIERVRRRHLAWSL